jgi:4-hydroxybenzoyl-CoA thioesterase
MNLGDAQKHLTREEEIYHLPRIDLDLPNHFNFRTEMDVRASDLDRSGCLKMEALLLLVTETRVKFYRSMGYHVEDVEGMLPMVKDAVMTDMAACAPGTVLVFEVTAGEFSRTGCDLFYRATCTRTGAVVAKAKTAIEFIHISMGRPAAVPDGFRRRFAEC